MGNTGNLENNGENASTQPTASTSGVLSFAQLQQAFRDMPENIPTAIILVAPNNTIAKQWRKDYPGVKVTTARRYYTSNVYAYPLPKDILTQVTDLVSNNSGSTLDVSNPQSNGEGKLK